MSTTILVPHDGSPGADDMLRFACDTVRRVGGRIVVLASAPALEISGALAPEGAAESEHEVAPEEPQGCPDWHMEQVYRIGNVAEPLERAPRQETCDDASIWPRCKDDECKGRNDQRIADFVDEADHQPHDCNELRGGKESIRGDQRA